MDSNILIWLLLDIFLLIIFLIFISKWLILQVRDICEDFEGFVKFTQIIFIFGSWFVFLSIFIYYIFLDPNETTPTLNLFLTIVVGFLGTIMGLFFSNEALSNLKKKYKLRGEKIRRDKNKLSKTLEKLEKSIENYKKKN